MAFRPRPDDPDRPGPDLDEEDLEEDLFRVLFEFFCVLFGGIFSHLKVSLWN